MAEESDKPKQRRMVKKAATLREQAEKSQQQAAKPKRSVTRQTGRYISAPFRPIGRQLAKLGKYKLFRIIGYIFVPPYFRNSWKELKQVTWPNRRESWQLTGAVIIFSIIFGLIIALVDFVLDKLFREVLLK